MNFEVIKLFNRYQLWLKPEAHEQALLVIWLEQNGYKFTSIPNSTWTKSFKQTTVNTITGLRPGLCDILIVLKRGSLLFLELKRPKKIKLKGGLGASPSSVSSEQLEWISVLSKIDNIEAQICYGCEDAKRFILSLESVK